MHLSEHPDQHAIRLVAESQGWLAGREPAARDAILSVARVKDFESGEAIYLAGGPPTGLYGLISGALDICVPRPDGQELAVHRAEGGFWVGDLAALADQPTLITVRAGAASWLLLLPRRELVNLLDRHPSLHRDFWVLTHANVATALWLLGNIAIPDSESRIVLRLLQLDGTQADREGWMQISQERLGQLVALSPATLQRCLRRLRAQGLVELAYGRLRVSNRRGLERLCSTDGTR